jgi:hypothetical protein
MITRLQFEMALTSLYLLDMEELVATGAIADRDYKAYDEFHADPFRWYLLATEEKAAAVWEAIRKHKPGKRHARDVPPPDNLVHLPVRKRRTDP